MFRLLRQRCVAARGGKFGRGPSRSRTRPLPRLLAPGSLAGNRKRGCVLQSGRDLVPRRRDLRAQNLEGRDRGDREQRGEQRVLDEVLAFLTRDEVLESVHSGLLVRFPRRPSGNPGAGHRVTLVAEATDTGPLLTQTAGRKPLATYASAHSPGVRQAPPTSAKGVPILTRPALGEAQARGSSSRGQF